MDRGPRERELRALAQRDANARAAALAEPLPHPNVWDRLDPTKVAAGAPCEAIEASYREFQKRCRTRPKRRLSF